MEWVGGMCGRLLVLVLHREARFEDARREEESMGRREGEGIGDGGLRMDVDRYR